MYVLNDADEPVPCKDFLVAAKWMDAAHETGQAVIGRTRIGRATVSTVFLGIDHAYSGKGPPVLWETMVFGGPEDGMYCQRYTSREDAIAGHANTCAMIYAANKVRRLTFCLWLAVLLGLFALGKLVAYLWWIR